METTKKEVLISSHGEMMFNRNATLCDICEQLDKFFTDHLVVINDATVDILGNLNVDRNNVKLLTKTDERWVYIDDIENTYTVFSQESADFMTDLNLSQLNFENILKIESDNSDMSDSEDKESEEIKEEYDSDDPTSEGILSEGWSDDSDEFLKEK